MDWISGWRLHTQQNSDIRIVAHSLALTSFPVTNVNLPMDTDESHEMSSGLVTSKSSHFVSMLPSDDFVGPSPFGERPPGLVTVHPATDTDLPAF